MGKIANSTNQPDQTDIRPKAGQAVQQGHKGGRRSKAGSGVVGSPKETQLSEARAHNQGHTKKFRAGVQDARDDNGPLSPSSLQVKMRRRGNGPMTRMPSPGGE
jgi:hypothetical protein